MLSVVCFTDVSRFFFFFNDTATTEIYTLSYTTLFRSIGGAAAGPRPGRRAGRPAGSSCSPGRTGSRSRRGTPPRSEEHTSELQSHSDLVCRLLLEKKKKKKRTGEAQ